MYTFGEKSQPLPTTHEPNRETALSARPSAASSLVLLTHDLGRLTDAAPVQRVSDPVVHPAIAPAGRYGGADRAFQRNISADIVERITDGVLAENATVLDTDDAMTLTIPNGAGAPTVVVLTFVQAAADAAYAPTAHALAHGGGGYTATITVHRTVTKAILQDVMRRELDEVVYGVVAARATADGGVVAGTNVPSVFTAGPTANGAAVTAFDQATAREIALLWDTPKLAAALTAAHLDNAHNLPPGDAKFTALRAAGITNEKIAWLTSIRRLDAAVTPVEHFFAHLDNARMTENFAALGISGGHNEANLRAFVAGRPELRLVDVTPGGAAGGVRKFQQYQIIDQAAVVGPPTDGGVNAGYLKAVPDKSTFPDTEAFLREAIPAFEAWRIAQGAAAEVTKQITQADAIATPTFGTLGGYITFLGNGRWTLNTLYPIV